MRSGLNLPIASASESFSAAIPDLSLCTTDFSSEPPSACSTAEPLPSSNTAMIPAEPGRQVLADLVVNLVLEAMIDELADQTAGDRADRHRGQQRRREQPDGQPDPAAPARALAAEMIARLPDRRHCHRQRG